jgi:predicted RNA-binding Zn-ribbon protein involved in translation (DUF1610 family)
VRKAGNMDINCPNCGADLSVRGDAVIHTCDYCGAAIQVSKMVAEPGVSKKEKQKFILKDHYIVRCNYTPDQAKNLLEAWISKVPGTPKDFEAATHIHSQKLAFYPLWVGQYTADTPYRGLGDLPKFSTPAFDVPGWYDRLKFYKEEETGEVVREYQIPLIGIRLDKSQKSLSDYVVTVSGKEYFDIKHVKDVNGEIIDTELSYNEVRNGMNQKVLDSQEREIRKEVKIIKSRKDKIKVEALYYIHLPIYEIQYTYKRKGYKALIDGSNGRIINAQTPIIRGFPAKTITLGAAHMAAGAILILFFYETLPFFSIVGGLGIIALGILFFAFAVNLRRRAEEKQV